MILPLPSFPLATLLSLAFYVALGGTALYSGFLAYHWIAYSESRALTFWTLAVYALGATLALALMAATLT